MPAVIPPLQPPERSITSWQQHQLEHQQPSFDGGRGRSGGAPSTLLTLLTTTQTSHWLLLAAPVAIVSWLLVAVVQCFRGSNNKRRSTWFSWFSPTKKPSSRRLTQGVVANVNKKYNTRGEPETKATPESDEKQDGKQDEKTEPEAGSKTDAQTAPPAVKSTQKRLRLRVYHLPERWATDPTTMNEPSRGRTATTTTITTMTAPEQHELSADSSAHEQQKQHFSSRPPPPLPLSTSSFVFDRPELDADYTAAMPSPPPDAESTDVNVVDASSISFIHQPNPDYTSAPSTEAATTEAATAAPDATAASPLENASTSAAQQLSSPPSSSPPPLPSSAFPAQVGVRGEIVSLLDDAGAGWTRHTRVYGGGVCLACLAAEGSGDGDGGMYGDNVPMEDRR